MQWTGWAWIALATGPPGALIRRLRPCHRGICRDAVGAPGPGSLDRIAAAEDRRWRCPRCADAVGDSARTAGLVLAVLSRRGVLRRRDSWTRQRHPSDRA